MSDSKLTQTFTTDDTKLLASYDKILRKQADMLAATLRLAQESKRSADAAKEALNSQSDGLNRVLGQVESLATGYFSVQTAIKLATDELQRHVDLQAKAKQAQLTVADARSAFLRNAVALSPSERSRAIGEIERISLQYGVDRRKLFPAAGGALSAAGNRSLDEVLDAVRVAARYVPGQSGEPEAVAAGLLDIASLTGSGDATSNLGVLAATQAKAHVTTTEETARHVVPAAINIASYGDKPSEALALAAAMTTAIKDYTGRQSGTATIRLAQQLNDFFKPDEIRKEVTDALTEKPGALGVAQTNPAIAAALDRFVDAEKGAIPALDRLKPGDTAGQVEYLKHNEELAEKFIQSQIVYRTAGGTLDSTTDRVRFMSEHPDISSAFFSREGFGASFEAKPDKQIENLLTDVHSEFAKNFSAYEKIIPRPEEARSLGEKALADVESDPLARQALTARRLESLSDRLLTGNIQAGEGGIARESLEKLLQGTGLGAFASRLERLDLELKTGFGTHDTFDALIGAMQKRIGELRYREAKPGEVAFSEVPRGGYFQHNPQTGEYYATPNPSTLDILGRQHYARRQDVEMNRQADLLEEGIQELKSARSASQLPEAGMPAPRKIGGDGAALDTYDYEGAAAGFTPGALEKYGIADEFEMLRTAEGADKFAGHEGDLGKLDDFISGQIQSERETTGNAEMLANLSGIRQDIQAMLAKLDKSANAAQESAAATKEAAAEQRAANRSNGARSNSLKGRE